MWYAIAIAVTAIVSFVAGAGSMLALIAWSAHDRDSADFLGVMGSD